LNEKLSLQGIRCVLVNPHLFPIDLRGEVQTSNEGDKHESGMNFGVLVAANSLMRAGAEVEIVDLQAMAQTWQQALTAAIERGSTRMVGVGTLSVYSFLPLVEILQFVRSIDPEISTVAGGQNAQNLPRLLARSGATHLLDYLVCGDGEIAIVKVAKAILDHNAPAMQGLTRPSSGEPVLGQFTQRVPLDRENSFLDYSLYPNFRHLWPVIEESRGCPYKCDFCANPLQGGAAIRFKAPELLVDEVVHVYKRYNASGFLPTVLMTSIFGVRTSVARRFFDLLQRTEMEPRFVASTRVDLPHEDYLSVGARYFDQMHFGFESGSPDVIRRMLKTDSPARYLSRAADTLAAWRDKGVHTGVNFIIGYLGETQRSVEESIAWLDGHRSCISSVWGGGLMAYPDSPFARVFRLHEMQYGASYEAVSDYCDMLQTWPINPSRELKYKDVLQYTDRVHDLFYDAASFYAHYKWYVGPQTNRDTVDFIPQDIFASRFKLNTTSRVQSKLG